MQRIPVYRLQVISVHSGKPVVFDPGGVHEADLVRMLVDEVAKENQGIFRTHAQVLASVESAVTRALFAFKASVIVK